MGETDVKFEILVIGMNHIKKKKVDFPPWVGVITLSSHHHHILWGRGLGFPMFIHSRSSVND